MFFPGAGLLARLFISQNCRHLGRGSEFLFQAFGQMLIVLHGLGAAPQGNKGLNGETMCILPEDIASDAVLGQPQSFGRPGLLEFDPAKPLQRVAGPIADPPPFAAEPFIPGRIFDIDTGEQVAIQQGDGPAQVFGRTGPHEFFERANVSDHGLRR